MSKWIVDIHGEIEGDYEIIGEYQEPKTGHWIEEKYFDTKGVIEEAQSAKCSECERYLTTPYLYRFNHYKFCPNCGARMKIKDMSSVQPKAEWIPVSERERLPKEETDVLVCNTNGDIEISCGSYSTEIKGEFIWYTSGWKFGEVVAWMPLPEPYKAESEG